MKISTAALPHLSAGNLQLPLNTVFELPEKVLQFGTGVLLRGLPDFFINAANNLNDPGRSKVLHHVLCLGPRRAQLSVMRTRGFAPHAMITIGLLLFTVVVILRLLLLGGKWRFQVVRIPPRGWMCVGIIPSFRLQLPLALSFRRLDADAAFVVDVPILIAAASLLSLFAVLLIVVVVSNNRLGECTCDRDCRAPSWRDGRRLLQTADHLRDLRVRATAVNDFDFTVIIVITSTGTSVKSLPRQDTAENGGALARARGTFQDDVATRGQCLDDVQTHLALRAHHGGEGPSDADAHEHFLAECQRSNVALHGALLVCCCCCCCWCFLVGGIFVVVAIVVAAVGILLFYHFLGVSICCSCYSCCCCGTTTATTILLLFLETNLEIVLQQLGDAPFRDRTTAFVLGTLLRRRRSRRLCRYSFALFRNVLQRCIAVVVLLEVRRIIRR